MKNKSVLITGSNKGLGKELALLFSSNKYNVILHGRNVKDLIKTKREIIKKGVDYNFVKGDLKSDQTIRRLYKIAKKKNILILINNAASHCPHLPLEKISDECIDEILITNLSALIKLTRRIYELFLKKGYGTVININSISGLEPQNLRTVYCASKWGLRGFTDTLRIEAQKNNIRIIGIYPSTIRTKSRFVYGMNPKKVAQKIYMAYKNIKVNELVIDNRPKKVKKVYFSGKGL